MAKSKHKIKSAPTLSGSATKAVESKHNIGTTEHTRISTVADLREHPGLWYKLCVLVYDLRNMTKDKTCERRTLQTTDPLYISEPYFDAQEAMAIKHAIVPSGMSVEQDINAQLEHFFEKRRASGDCRPCGPHDMVPVYLACFGIDKAEIEDEKFVSRLGHAELET